MYHMSQYMAQPGLQYIAQAAVAPMYTASARIYQSAVAMPAQTFIYNTQDAVESEQSVYSLPVSYGTYLPTKAQDIPHFVPDTFVKPGFEGMFVGHADQIREYVEQTFQIMFNQSFPRDIKVSVLNQQEFRKVAPSSATIGLSINRTKQGQLSEIFVLNDSLARVMLTFGHELGHVLTETLDNAHDEEAKAYAFSLAWMRIIKEHNIANLGEAIVLENPAPNGLHDVAFKFLQSLLDAGKTPLEVYNDLIARNVSIHINNETLFPYV